MLIQKKSRITLNFSPDSSGALRIAGDFHDFGNLDSALIFCKSSLLHVFIDGYSSLKSEDTKVAIEKIRASVRSAIGDVAYVRSNGDDLRTLNPVSALAAFSMMGSEYIPALVSMDALRIFRNRYPGKFLEELPAGWRLESEDDQ